MMYRAEPLPLRAIAYLKGSSKYPNIQGFVLFTTTPYGTQVQVYVQGLPPFQPGKNGAPSIGPHGFHIHGIGSCEEGNKDEPFTAAGEHWNPNNQPHPNHPGDFPVLFSYNGFGNMMFITNRFTVQDILGKSVILHESPDDFKTQPAGASGKRIACGIIRPYQM